MRLWAAVVLLAVPAASGQEASPADRLLSVVERRHREAGDPADPRALAARLGFDRAQILEFVRSDVAWEPYAGVLRDAAGTLLARAGNSLDRALLLQALLEAGGEKTRLMRVDLAPADGARLLETWRRPARPARPGVDLKALARDLGVDEAALESTVRERRRHADALLDEVRDAAGAEAARLSGLVGAIAAPPREAPKEHVWVQVSERGGWTDADPSPVPLPAKGGRPFSPAELLAQRRTVTIRLILNRKSGGRVESVPLLAVPSDLAAISWRAVDLLVLPPPGQLPPVAKLRGMDPPGVLAAFRQVKQYRPALMIGGKSFGGIPFDLEGRTYSVEADGRIGSATALAGGVNRVFGGALGGEEAPAASPSALESVVLQVAVKEPGAAERIHRRTLVSVPKPGLRLLPILRYSFLVDGAPLPEGEYGRREAGAIAHNAASLRRLIRGEREGVHFNQHVDVPPLLLRFGDFRRRLIVGLAAGAAFAQDRPGVVAETSQAVMDEPGGRILIRRGIDILENPGFFDGAADRTLALGVAETILECLLVERRWPGEARRSAWTLMERARLQGGKPDISDREGRREVRWSADAWWSVDPAGGGCVGRVPSGAGQGLIEAAWDKMNAVCTYSDISGFLSGAGAATGRQPQWAQDTSNLFGKACGVVGGTWARDAANDQINEVTKDLWPGAIDALSGM